VDDEPTLPNLRVQGPAGAPVWPPPQPPRPEERHLWRGVLLFVVVALLSFGVVRGVTIVLAQANGSTAAPPASGPGPHTVPTHLLAPTAVPTDTPQPTETAQPTPTFGGGD
jgi:hypothetical protein